MTYRAFLSYSHADEKHARWLHRALEAYRPPRALSERYDGPLPRSLGPIFRDWDELPSTPNLSLAVQQALAESEAMIVVCSPRAAVSWWVNEEIRAFKRLGKSNRILCYVIDGEPGSGDARECFPAALTEVGPDGLRLEPVAADARSGGDGHRNAMLKIAAGLLGVGFDALRQRDHRKRIRRMGAMTSGALLVASVTILLAIDATIARNEAESRRAQADDLIDFMLGDLQDSLGEIGRLDVYDSVGDKAIEYFAAQRDGDDSEVTLLQRAENLRQIGDVRMERGQLAAALAAFEESLFIMERLADSSPSNPDAQIGLANSHFYVGYVHWQRGELRAAREKFELVVAIVDRLVSEDSSHPRWLVEQGYAYTNLGRVLELEGDFESALGAYRRVMEIDARLMQIEPENPEWELELGFAHNNLGKLVVALGRLDEAEQHYRTDLEIKSRLHLENTGHNGYRSYLATSQFYLGQLLEWRGEFAEAERLIDESRENFAYLNEFDPDRATWEHRRANVERELASVYEATGRLALSQEFLDSSIGTLGELTGREEDVTAWRKDLAHSLLLAADLRIRHGDTVHAEAYLRSAREHLNAFLEPAPTSLEVQELFVYADVCHARMADSAAAAAAYRAALDRIDEHFPESSDPRVAEMRAAALEGLGRAEEAASIRRSLREIGFVGRRL